MVLSFAISILEAYFPFFYRDYPIDRYCHSMRVAPQIIKHSLRIGEGLLGIHYPFLFSQLLKPSLEVICVRESFAPANELEPIFVVCLMEQVKHFPTVYLAQR